MNLALTAKVKCGLVEVYQITSVSIYQFVPQLRQKQCFPKFRCDRQTIDKVTRSARLFIFCDKAMDERLAGDKDLNQYFNAAISDNFCIGGPYGHRVGEKCEKKTGDPNDLLTTK